MLPIVVLLFIVCSSANPVLPLGEVKYLNESGSTYYFEIRVPNTTNRYSAVFVTIFVSSIQDNPGHVFASQVNPRPNATDHEFSGINRGIIDSAIFTGIEEIELYVPPSPTAGIVYLAVHLSFFSVIIIINEYSD
jgi:hypothetical protein